MTLTGKPVLVVAALAALALPIGCMWYWTKSSKIHRGRVGVRLSLFLSSQLSVVLVTGLALNDYGQFYSSWSDLAGTNSATPAARAAAHFGGPDTHVQPSHVPVTALDRGGFMPNIPAEAAKWDTLSWSSKADWPLRGAIVDTEVTGPASGLTQQALVYLPPRYFRTSPTARKMPVVEVLTGFPGSPMNLVNRTRYPDHEQQAIAAGTAQDMVLVMMRPAPAFPWDTECSDVPGGPQSLQFFTQDVPAAITSQFGLEPTGWGTIGDSTGGYCAAKIAMFDPARFPAAVVLSGYFRPVTDMTTRGIFSGRPVFKQENDLMWRLANEPIPAISMLIATARDEHGEDGYGTAVKWLQAVRAPLSADELLLDHGGHNFNTWGRELPFALQWLSEHLPMPS